MATYLSVSGDRGRISFAQTLPAWGYSETDPKELVARWIAEGGIFLTERFIPWKLIDRVTWTFNWTPRD